MTLKDQFAQTRQFSPDMVKPQKNGRFYPPGGSLRQPAQMESGPYQLVF